MLHSRECVKRVDGERYSTSGGESHARVAEHVYRGQCKPSITPSRQGCIVKPQACVRLRPRKASLIKAPKKCPKAAPASTSEGKCLWASTRAQAVPAVRVVKPMRKAIYPPAGNDRDARFRAASISSTAVCEVWPEGKLKLSEPSGRGRCIPTLRASVTPAVKPIAAAPTASPSPLAVAHSLNCFPLGVARTVIP